MNDRYDSPLEQLRRGAKAGLAVFLAVALVALAWWATA